MNLIAYGEIHFLNGEASLFARFAQADGASFDLPLSAEQFQVLLSGINALPQEAAAPAQKRASYGDDEDDEVDDARPFSVAANGRDEDDDL